MKRLNGYKMEIGITKVPKTIIQFQGYTLPNDYFHKYFMLIWVINSPIN